jgi:hypothetical protein
MSPVSFVAMGARIDTSGVPKKAISKAFFSRPFGFLERREGTIKSHQNQ